MTRGGAASDAWSFGRGGESRQPRRPGLLRLGLLRLGLLLALVLLGAAGVVVWRVLAPAEVIASAKDPYPPAVAHPPGVTGETAGAPLIVQGRVRVFAAKRQVSADAPVDAKTSYTPRWSYRRWPAQLNGVAAVGRTVISRWSDGRLVAIDAATGTIAWRAAGPPAGGYTGLGTGAATVWAPPGLFTSGTTVLATGGGRVVAYSAASGEQTWRAGCSGDGFTTAGGTFVCGGAAYVAATGAPVLGWPTGPLTPLDCGVARSGCGGVRTATGATWLATAPRPAPVRGGLLAAGLALTISGGTVAAASALTGAPAWRWSAPAGQTAGLLGSGPGVVYLLTGARDLVTIDAATGAVRSAFRLAVGAEKTTWTPGLWQAEDGYAAVERLDDPDPRSVHHYFTVETVIIAAV